MIQPNGGREVQKLGPLLNKESTPISKIAQMVTRKEQSSPKLYTSSVWSIFNKEMGGNLKKHQA